MALLLLAQHTVAVGVEAVDIPPPRVVRSFDGRALAGPTQGEWIR